MFISNSADIKKALKLLLNLTPNSSGRAFEIKSRNDSALFDKVCLVTRRHKILRQLKTC